MSDPDFHHEQEINLHTVMHKLNLLQELVIDVKCMLTFQLEQGELIMASLADITVAVAAETTVEASVVALLTQLSADLQAALANNDPVAMQAVVDSINANAAAMAAAVAANTPAPPVVTPPATP